MESLTDQSDGECTPVPRPGDAPPPQPTPALPIFRSLKILYADDNRLLGDVLLRFLHRAGHQAEHAPDGLAAWKRVSRDLARFDVVITDNDMPELSGIELVKRLRAASFGGRIIVHSSALMERELAQYQDLKVDHIVPKGVGAQAMISVVQELSGN